MKHPFRIGIVGIGAVGGYFGGILAHYYSGSDKVEIIFIARGDNEKTIKEKGLKIITPHKEHIAHPKLVSYSPSAIGKLDLVICAVKGYNLEESLDHIKECITPQTIILPLLNGVDATDRLKKVFPENEIWEGCVYIMARLSEPGVVKETGEIQQLHFGSDTGNKTMLKYVEKIFADAGLDARLSENIKIKTWSKFLFISPVASANTYLDEPIGAIMQNPAHRQLLIEMIKELKSIADAKNIGLPDTVIQETIDRADRQLYDAATSMHSDFALGKKTEVESLTTWVVKEGEKLNVPTPVYQNVLDGLIKKVKF